jgi:hypothetical protein
MMVLDQSQVMVMRLVMGLEVAMLAMAVMVAGEVCWLVCIGCGCGCHHLSCVDMLDHCVAAT